MYFPGVPPPGLDVFMKTSAGYFVPRDGQLPPGIPVQQSQEQDFAAQNDNFLNSQFSFEHDAYGSEYSMETSETHSSPGPFTETYPPHMNDADIEKRNKLKEELLQQITKNEVATSSNEENTRKIVEQLVLQMNQKKKENKMSEDTKITNESERKYSDVSLDPVGLNSVDISLSKSTILSPPPGLILPPQNTTKDVEETPFELKRITRELLGNAKPSVLSPPPGLPIPQERVGWYSRNKLMDIKESMVNNRTIQKLPHSADIDEVHRSKIDAQYGSGEPTPSETTQNSNTHYQFTIQPQKQIKVNENWDRNINKREEESFKDRTFDQKLPISSVDSETKTLVASEENWCDAEENFEPISPDDYEAEFYPQQQPTQRYHNVNENFNCDRPGPSNNVETEKYGRTEKIEEVQNYSNPPKVKKNRFTHPKPKVQPSHPPTDFNPATFLHRDDRFKNFRIWQHFCRGRPLTVEGRRNSPLEGMEFAEIMEIFKNMVVQRAVVKEKQDNRDHDKPPASEVEYRGERQFENRRPQTAEYKEQVEQNNIREEYYGHDDCRINADYQRPNYDERQRKQPQQYRTESPYHNSQLIARAYNDDCRGDDFRRQPDTPYRREDDRRINNNEREYDRRESPNTDYRSRNVSDRQDGPSYRPDSRYSDYRIANVSNRSNSPAYRAESPYYQQQSRIPNEPRREDENYQFGNRLYNNYLNRNNR